MVSGYKSRNGLVEEYLLEGDADEVALLDEGMGQGELGSGEREVVVEQEVEVDGTVVVLTIGALAGAAEHALDVLSLAQALMGGEGGEHTRCPVEEGMRGLEAPRLGLDERGDGLDVAYGEVDQAQGLEDEGPTVAKIATETNVEVVGLHGTGGN